MTIAVDSPAEDTETSSAPPRWYLPGMIGIVLAALAVRVVNVLVWRPTCDEDLVEVARHGDPTAVVNFDNCFRIWGDSAYSHIQGRHIAEGTWFIDSFRWYLSRGTVEMPSSGDPPLFALLLAALSKLGITSGAGQRLVTGVIGVVGVVLLATLVRRLVGPRAALVAGVIGAVYPMLWINDGMLLSETLYVPLILLAMHAAYSFWERPGYGTGAWFGVAMALAALTRAEALILLGLMPLPLLWGLRHRYRRGALLRYGVVAIGTGCLVVAPWLAYNLTRFENPALMTSATGAVLSSSNCDITYYSESIGYYGNCFDEYVAKGWMVGRLPTCTQEVVDAIAVDPKTPEASKCWPNDPSFDETERDKFSSELAVRYIKENKGRLPIVALARVGRMWDLYTPELGSEAEPLGQNVRLNYQIEGRGKIASQAGLVAFWAMLPFAVVGLVALWRRRVPVSPLLSMTIVITVTAALTFGITRYRVPVDIVVVVLAAAGVDALLRLLGAGDDRATIGRRRGDDGAAIGPDAPQTIDDADSVPAGRERDRDTVLAGIIPVTTAAGTDRDAP